MERERREKKREKGMEEQKKEGGMEEEMVEPRTIMTGFGDNLPHSQAIQKDWE